MINVEMILPEFAKMVHRSLSEKSIPQLSFSHTAFKDNEHELLGSAVKYCYLKHINVIILGEPNTKNIRNSDENGMEKRQIEIEIKEYNNNLKKLGKDIKGLVNDYFNIYILADYSNLCLNCGAKMANIRKELGDINYWHKDDNFGEVSHSFSEEYMEAMTHHLENPQKIPLKEK
jgi:hypothetical protein